MDVNNICHLQILKSNWCGENMMEITYKECDLGSNKTYAEVMGGFLPNLADFYQNPKKYNIHKKTKYTIEKIEFSK